MFSCHGYSSLGLNSAVIGTKRMLFNRKNLWVRFGGPFLFSLLPKTAHFGLATCGRGRFLSIKKSALRRILQR